MKIRATLLSCLVSLACIGSAHAGSILLEAEAHTASGGGSFDLKTDRPGSSGGKALAGWDNDQQWLEWKFEVPQAGDYALTLRYAGGRNGVVWREVRVNGKLPGAGFERIALANTGGWGRSAGEWKNLTIGAEGKPLTLKLAKGSNVIRLTSLGGEGGSGSANLDAVLLHTPGRSLDGLLAN